jgi:hypothetical protein
LQPLQTLLIKSALPLPRSRRYCVNSDMFPCAEVCNTTCQIASTSRISSNPSTRPRLLPIGRGSHSANLYMATHGALRRYQALFHPKHHTFWAPTAANVLILWGVDWQSPTMATLPQNDEVDPSAAGLWCFCGSMIRAAFIKKRTRRNPPFLRMHSKEKSCTLLVKVARHKRCKLFVVSNSRKQSWRSNWRRTRRRHCVHPSTTLIS